MLNISPTQIEKTDILLPPITMLVLAFWFWLSGDGSGIFSWINVVHMWFDDWLWQNVTILGNVLLLVSVLAVFLRFHGDWVLAVMIGLLLSTLSVQILKHGLALGNVNTLPERFEVFLLSITTSDDGFPSMYGASVFVLATVVFFGMKSKMVAMLVLALACLVALSRLILASHTPVDIFIGVAIGWLCGYIGIYLTGKLTRIHKAVFVLIALVVLSASIALFFHQSGYHLAFEMQMIIGALGVILSLHALYWAFSASAQD